MLKQSFYHHSVYVFLIFILHGQLRSNSFKDFKRI